MKFRALLEKTSKTACGMRVPEKIVEGLSSSRKPAVKVTINGYTYRSSIAFMGGEFWLGANAAVREAAGIAAGQTLDVEVVLDTEPRVVDVPEDFQKALDGDAKAKEEFGKLAYSHKYRHVWAINDAKTAETRQRRIEKSLEMLRAGKGK